MRGADADRGRPGRDCGDGGSGDTTTDSCDEGEPFFCDTCGDRQVSPICDNGVWTCEPIGECPPVECDGTNDDEAPACVDNCEDQNVIGQAECWVSGEWDCGDEGERQDLCDET